MPLPGPAPSNLLFLTGGNCSYRAQGILTEEQLSFKQWQARQSSSNRMKGLSTAAGSLLDQEAPVPLKDGTGQVQQIRKDVCIPVRDRTGRRHSWPSSRHMPNVLLISAHSACTMEAQYDNTPDITAVLTKHCLVACRKNCLSNRATPMILGTKPFLDKELPLYIGIGAQCCVGHFCWSMQMRNVHVMHAPCQENKI